MSTRNFILLIIILSLGVIAVFVFLFFRKEPVLPPQDGAGINFDIPFGGSGATKPPATLPPADISGYEPEPSEETQKAKLVKVSSMPVAGFTVFPKERIKEINPSPTLPLSGEGVVPPDKGGLGGLKKPAKSLTEFAPNLRYTAKENGNIYQTFADKIKEEKFSGTIIPKVYDAYFGNRGESVIMRYLKIDDRTIETFVGTLPKELLGAEVAGNNEVKGYFLPNNVKDISLSPDGQKIFYMFESENSFGENIIGTILNFSNNRKTQIFDSPFTEWLSQWPNNNIITLSTKPSGGASGYMYTMDSAGKNFGKVLGAIDGLTTLGSPNGKLILYGDSNLSLNIYHADTRNTDALAIRTLPEKCIWGKVSDVVFCAVPKLIGFRQYPDSWYQGEVSFSDQLWKIDAKTGNATLLADPATVRGGEEIDGIKLAMDERENYLFFVNKKDSFLWKLELK